MKKFKKKIFWGLLFLLILAVPVQIHAESLQELQQKQEALDQQIQANRNAISSKQQQINDIEGVISSLDGQISGTEKDINFSISKIDLTTSQINETQAEIEAKLKELEKQKANLFETIRVYYENSSQSTLEVLVGSDSLSDVIDKSQYLESVSSRLDEQVTAINKAKAELETRRNELQKQKTDLESQKASLLEKRKNLDLQKNQKNNLLNQSVTEKNSYQAKLNELRQEHSKISDAIYAQRRASGGITYGSSDYPFYSIDVPDPWGFLTRECTSYVAWYLNAKEGKNWYNTQPGRGSARYWDEIARTLGWTVSSTPRVGAAISWKGPLYAGDQWGHVAIVEAVNPNGTIDISEYNWVKYSYSYRSDVNPGAYGSYVYIY